MLKELYYSLKFLPYPNDMQVVPIIIFDFYTTYYYIIICIKH